MAQLDKDIAEQIMLGYIRNTKKCNTCKQYRVIELKREGLCYDCSANYQALKRINNDKDKKRK